MVNLAHRLPREQVPEIWVMGSNPIGGVISGITVIEYTLNESKVYTSEKNPQNQIQTRINFLFVLRHFRQILCS